MKSPLTGVKLAWVWASAFVILSVKLFLWSCPTFDVFFIQIPPILCQFRKTCFSSTVQLKRRMKEGLWFFFSKGGWGEAFPKAPSDFLHSWFWHFFHGLSVFWEKTLLVCQNATCYKCSRRRRTTHRVTSWSAEVSSWQRAAQLPGPYVNADYNYMQISCSRNA